MASDVSIVNAAFLSLGARVITAFTDPSPEARLANRRYADVRDDFLRRHPWNFALRRVTITASSTSPDWEHTNAYPVPTDFLRLHEINNDSKIPYTLENTAADGTIIATDMSSPIEINYVRSVTDANLMDPSFRSALSMECAAEWAEKLTGNSEKVELAAIRAARATQAARTVDGQEVFPLIDEVFDWTDSRV